MTDEVSYDKMYSFNKSITKKEGGDLTITSDIIRGHTETIILYHLMERDTYGYDINKSIIEKTDGLYELKEATLYSAFRRLEQAEMITSYWGDENTGARRRYYTITEKGRREYMQSVEDWQGSKKLIDKLIGGDIYGK